MIFTSLIILVLGALGHATLWVAAVNRLHATSINRNVVSAVTGLCGLAVTLLPLAVLVGIVRQDGLPHTLAWAYVAGCAIVGIVAILLRLRAYFHSERKAIVLSNHTACIDVRRQVAEPLVAPGIPTWLSHLPGNEALTITVHEKELGIPRLTAAHEGLRIVHLSDLHMSGRIGKAYFVEVIDEVNAAEADVVAITGDIVERDQCINWIPDTLGRLEANCGLFYVLGNHDHRVNERRLHAALAETGWRHLGGAWRLVTVRSAPLILAGNELPWHDPAADLSTCPPHGAGGVPLRVLLAHSPDQFDWAQRHEIDLMLAGHNHGGQVRLPLVGAILAPSMHGTRYAAGAFRRGNTVMHVSRGTSSLTPLRWNCPPEIAVLTLRAAGERRA